MRYHKFSLQGLILFSKVWENISQQLCFYWTLKLSFRILCYLRMTFSFLAITRRKLVVKIIHTSNHTDEEAYDTIDLKKLNPSK